MRQRVAEKLLESLPTDPLRSVDAAVTDGTPARITGGCAAGHAGAATGAATVDDGSCEK
jgi:hypothetical protein